MKFKFLLALALGAALTASAQGYKDGVEYYKAGQYDNAITLLQRNMNDASTDKALAQYYLGQAYLAKGNKAKASAAFDAGVAANPENPYNYVGIGAIQLLDGNANLAKDNFKKAQSLAKKNAEVTVDIARAYYNADPVKYQKEIDQAILKAHKDSKDKEPAIYIFEGDRKAKDRDWGAAATEYEQAISFDQDNPEGYVKYANVYFYIQPDYAIQKLNELLERNPTSALAQRELAEKYYEADKWTRAAEQYGKYIANPNHFPEDKARYAVLLYSGQKYPEAINVSREVLNMDPTNFQAQRIIVRSLGDLNKDSEALAESKKLFDNPGFADRLNASDYSIYAGLLAKDSLETEALDILNKGIAKFPGNASMLFALADYYDGRDYPTAAKYIDQYLNASENPGRSDYFDAARICLGAVYAAKEDSVARTNFAKQGINYMNKSMEGLDLEQIPPSFIRRLGLMQLQSVNNVANADVAATFQRLLDRMNMTPEYSNPASDRNLLNYYVDAYRYLAQYYSAAGDTEKADQAKADMEKYAAMIQK